MLFNAFSNAVKKYPDRLALNEFTYKEVLALVNEREYSAVCSDTDWTIILSILKASSVNKPITILPKFRRNDITVSSRNKEFGITLFSSGSTGDRKGIFMPERMILANAENAIECQQLTSMDKILTVCSLNHTGGISAQTLPGLLVGAHVIIEPFNAFNMLRLIDQHKITVTHLVPVMIDALKIVRSSADVSSLRLVVAGSDCVYKQHVEFWLNQKIPFMVNYGLTEAGPMIINHTFTEDDLNVFELGVPLGKKLWCEFLIVKGELWLRGHNVFLSFSWFPTGDCVELVNDWFIYKGRISAGCKIVPKQY